MPKTIIIYDIAFYNNKCGVNFLAMRISSFHKQQGDFVKLANNAADLGGKYDVMYILKADGDEKNPDTSLLLNSRSRIYGIDYFSNWKPGAAILACRPDYDLYVRNSAFEYADALQFTDNNGHALSRRQNADNAYAKEKMTLVCDENLWSLGQEQLTKVLSELKTRKNIYFLQPVSLRRISSDKLLTSLFLELKLTRLKPIVWANSMPFNRDNIGLAFNFFEAFKAAKPTLQIGEVRFNQQSLRGPQSDMITSLYFMKRCKETKINMQLTGILNRMQTEYADYYNLIAT